MNRTTSTIAALLVATMAVGAAAPVMAQNQGAGAPGTQIADRGDGMRGDRDGRRMMRHRGGEMGGGILALVCAENGGDRLEHMLLSIEQRTDPTADQQALYDAFKSAATSAQSDFAATCAAALPSDATAAADTDLVDRLTTRHDLAKAQVAAMDTVLPAFEAFYDSLSDEQKQALEPRRGEDRDRGFHHERRGAPERG